MALVVAFAALAGAATLVACALRLRSPLSFVLGLYVLAWSGLVALTEALSLVRGVGAIGQFFGRLTTGADERVINVGVDESTIGAQGFGRVMSRWHSGQIQTYLGAVALGTLALILLYAWLG